MKLVAYVIVGFLAIAVALIVITGMGRAIPADHPAMMLAIVMLFAIPPLGAMSIRYERHPLPMVLLAFVPFTFCWYYFERVRSGKLTRNREFAR